MEKELIKELNDITNKLAALFCEKHDIIYDGWVGDRIGEVFFASDFYVDFSIVKYDLDTNQPKEMFFEWYDHSYDENLGGNKPINYQNYCLIDK